MAERDWRVDVLRALKAPINAVNLKFLRDWQQREGGHTANSASWNWLNTTSGTQYPAINSVGVRKFPNYATGISQTVSTLQNGRYTSVVRGLRSGNPYSSTLRQGVLGDLSTWVSGSRTRGLRYAANVLGAPGGNVPQSQEEIDKAAQARLQGQLQGLGGPVGKLRDVGGGVVDVVKAPYEAIRWVGGNWDRVLEVTGGFILLLVGLILLGRSMGVGGRKLGGDLANRLEYGPTVVRASERPTQTVRVHEVTDAGERTTARAPAQRRFGAVPETPAEKSARFPPNVATQTDEIPF